MTKRAKYLLDIQNRHSGSEGRTHWQRWREGIACTGPTANAG